MPCRLFVKAPNLGNDNVILLPRILGWNMLERRGPPIAAHLIPEGGCYSMSTLHLLSVSPTPGHPRRSTEKVHPRRMTFFTSCGGFQTNACRGHRMRRRGLSSHARTF